MRPRLLGILAVVAALLAGCGGGGAARQVRGATLILDFTPNAIHAGIYLARARGYDRAEGVQLHVIAPSASSDSIKLLETGHVQFAILDLHDLAIARERGAAIVGVMAIVQRPLAAVIAAPPIRDPRALEHQLVGVTGVPSDTAVLHSTVAGAGGDPGRVKTVTIGFNAVEALLSGRVAAATAFWDDEGVTLLRRRPAFHVFRVDAYGAPSYPELVLCATASTVKRDGALVRGVVGALKRGYAGTLADPAAAEHALESRVPGLDRQLVAAQLSAVEPALRPVGQLLLPELRKWAVWEARFGIVARPPDVATTFDPRFTG